MAERVPQNPVYQHNPMEYMPPNPAGDPAAQVQDNPLAVGAVPRNPASDSAAHDQDNPVAECAVPPETEVEQPEEAPSRPPVDGSNLPRNIADNATLRFLFNLGVEEHCSASRNIPNGNTRPAREDTSSVETDELFSLVEGNKTPAREDISSVEIDELSSLVEGNTTPAREDTSSVEIDELSSLVEGNTTPAREDISSVEIDELSSLVEGNTTPAREDTSSVEIDELSSLVEGNTTPAREDTSSVEIDELSSLVEGNTTPAREDISSVEIDELSSLVEGNTTPAREDSSSVEIDELSSLVDGNTTPAREDTSSVEIDELSSLVDRLDIDQSPEEQAQSIEHGKIPAIGFTYTGEKSVALKIMLKMGYEPGKGLGSSLPGIVNPVEARGTHGRQGLGYSPPEQEAAKPEGDSSLEVLYQNQPSGALQHLEDIMVPDYPAVRMTALTFYEHLCVLLRTSSLVHQNSNPIQVQKFCFVLSQRQLIEIGYSKFKRNGKLEVQLRICNLDTETVQKDAFPPKLMIKVNGHCVQLKTAPSSRPGSEPEPIPGPIDIEEFVHPTSSKYNEITIYWDSELRGRYAVTVNLVRPLPLQKVVSSSSSEKEDDDDQDDDDDEDDDDDIVYDNDVDCRIYFHHRVVDGGNDACNGEVNQLAGTSSSNDYHGVITSTSGGTNNYDGAVASTSSGISHQTCKVIDRTFSDSD